MNPEDGFRRHFILQSIRGSSGESPMPGTRPTTKSKCVVTVLRTGIAGCPRVGNDDAVRLCRRVTHDDPWLPHDRPPNGSLCGTSGYHTLPWTRHPIDGYKEIRRYPVVSVPLGTMRLLWHYAVPAWSRRGDGQGRNVKTPPGRRRRNRG